MSLCKLKYRRSTSILILTGYLLTFSVGVFHYHHHDFTSIKVFDNESKGPYNHFLILNGKTNDCIIHQNFSNIQTAVTSVLNNYRLIKQEQIPLPFPEASDQINSGHLLTKHLRAPPQIS